MKKGKKWYKSFGNWLVVIACIILVVVLLMNIYIIFQSKTNKDQVPSVFGYKPFIVLSGSMEGQIHKGDLILTKTVDPSTLKIKDIIAFRDAENTVTTHRIIDIVESDGVVHFITKGDNNSTQDRNLVSYEDVEGIYIGRISGFGSIMKGLSNPTTILTLALVITMAFVIGFAISVQKDKKLEREEFLQFKMMKEEQAGQKRQYENEELLQLRKQKEQQEKEALRIKLIRELQNRGYSRDEILELLRAHEEQARRNHSK